MKAAVYGRYGPPDVVKIKDCEKPVPKDNEVLIRVHAASINPYDWHFMRGTPYLLRLQAGLRKPKFPILGADVAGRIEAIGRNVTRFKPGDPVFGICRGAYAEYACAAESALVTKPETVTFEQAASVAIAALTALQGVRDKGHIQPGQKVLINGASGGVGTFAVQIAKSFDTEVTGVCSSRNVEMVRSIGADHVLDYTQADFTKAGQQYDMIFDAVGNHSFSKCRNVLHATGTYVAAGGQTDPWLIGPLLSSLRALVLSWFVSQKVAMFVAKVSKEDLTTMSALMEAGKITPVIDRMYTLEEVPEAIRYLEEGHARGKVVVTLPL